MISVQCGADRTVWKQAAVLHWTQTYPTFTATTLIQPPSSWSYAGLCTPIHIHWMPFSFHHLDPYGIIPMLSMFLRIKSKLLNMIDRPLAIWPCPPPSLANTLVFLLFLKSSSCPHFQICHSLSIQGSSPITHILSSNVTTLVRTLPTLHEMVDFMYQLRWAPECPEI
jgi:hypothetical protein